MQPQHGGVITIQNCYNRGNVTGNLSEIGGILGRYVEGNTALMDIKYCYNTGDITSETNHNRVGSIIGYAANINLTTCYTSTDLKFRGVSAGGSNTNCQKSLGSNLTSYATNLGSGYKNDRGINNGYPILSWQ